MMREILDDSAISRLYQQYYRPLYNIVYRHVWNAADAHDLVQEAFTRLWMRRQEVDANSPAPWLFKVALNLARNRRRWKKLWRWTSEEALADEPDAASPLSLVQQWQEQRDLEHAIADLPDKLRTVVLMTCFSEMTQAEVAVTLGIPAGTVASRRSLAIAGLRQRLAPAAALPEKLLAEAAAEVAV